MLHMNKLSAAYSCDSIENAAFRVFWYGAFGEWSTSRDSKIYVRIGGVQPDAARILIFEHAMRKVQ